ncbi:MAG TPA: hypothetical protein VMF88_00220 [Bacteroidota bacterium]|nr:hypothetical protein [Bacteroidota bacterium]
MTIREHSLSIVAVACALTVIGCGESQVLLDPDYSRQELVSNKIIGSDVKVTSVVDRRAVDPYTIGSAETGLFNTTVPYRVTIPVAEFVKAALDSLLPASPSNANVPVEVFIDSMEVREDNSQYFDVGIFDAKIIFKGRFIRESAESVTVRVYETVRTGDDVTKFLELLIYKGIVDCSRDLSAGAKILDYPWSAVPRDSANAATKSALQRPNAGENVIGEDNKSKTEVCQDIDFMYFRGGKIQAGYRFAYNSFGLKESSAVMLGYGAHFEVLRINNTDNNINGTMVTFGGHIGFRWLTSDRPVSPFVGGTAALTGGDETVHNANGMETSFFFGPILRETVGFSFDKQGYLEIGFFEMKLFRSTMLPYDTGITAGVAMGF